MANGETAASVDRGVARFPLPETDTGIAFYETLEAPSFSERAAVPYAMTALDPHVYHGYLADLRPNDSDVLIVDVGGGDGRNAILWLDWGFRRIVVIDPAGADREGGSLSHTTVRTGPYTAVREVALTHFDQGGETERFEVGIGEPY
jgi:hypothetical protein